MTKFIENRIAVAIFFFLLCLLTFSNSLHNQFLIDDYGAIFSQKKIPFNTYIQQQISPDFLNTMGIKGSGESVYYRPVAHIMFYLWSQLFGENVFFHHLANLFLFFFTSLILCRCVYILFNNQYLAWITTVLFIVHPLNGFLVNYITASYLSVQLMLMLSCLICILNYKDKEYSRKYLLLAVFFMLVSFICHETSIIMPFYAILTLWIIKRGSIKERVIDCLPLILMMVVYVLWRMKFASLNSSILLKMSAQGGVSFLYFIGHFPQMINWYVGQFFWPASIVMIWSNTHISSFQIILNIVIFVSAFVILIRLWPKFSIPGKWGMGVFLMNISLIIFASFFQSHHGLIIEPHWLNFGFVGLSVFTVDSLSNFSVFRRKLMSKLIFVCIILTLLLFSWQLNRRWRNLETYSSYWLINCPEFKSAEYYLAESKFMSGDIDLARKHFNNALEGYASDWQIYNNLGLIDFQENKFDSALINFKKAMDFAPKSAVIYNNLGLLNLNLNNLSEAESSFRTSINLNRFYPETYLNLISLLRKQHRYDEAIGFCQKVFEIDPGNGPAWNNLIQIYLDAGQRLQLDEAIKKFMKTVKDPKILTQIGSLLASKGMVDEALNCFELALKNDGKSVSAHIELGKLLANLNNFHDAIKVWEEGQRFCPECKEFVPLIAEAQKLVNNGSLIQ